MNPFSVLESDDEDETPKVVTKTKQPAVKKPQQQAKAPAPAPVEAAPPITEKPNSGRGGNSRGRGGAGRGRGRGGDKKGKHEGFDRQSGTGRGKEVSKSGSGKGNWGNPKEEAEHAEKEHLEDVAATAETPADEEENAPGAVVEEAVPEVVEPEVPTYTLDQYLATRDSARSNNEIFGAFSVRAVDASEFSGMKTKEESEDIFIALGAAKASKKKEQNQRSAKNNVILDVGFSVAPTEVPTREGGRGRGRGRGEGGREGRGRGEGRGGRGRGGGRRSNDPKVDIHDSNAFPAL